MLGTGFLTFFFFFNLNLYPQLEWKFFSSGECSKEYNFLCPSEYSFTFFQRCHLGCLAGPWTMKSHVPRGCRGLMEKHAGRAGSHVVITGSRSVASERGPGALIMKCVAMASGQPDSFLSLQAISGPMPKSVNTHRLSRSCRSRPQCGHSKAHVADNTCEGRHPREVFQSLSIKEFLQGTLLAGDGNLWFGFV